MKVVSILMLVFFVNMYSNFNDSNKEQGTVEIEFSNVQLDKGGKIYLAVFNEKSKFMTRESFIERIIEVSEENLSQPLVIKNLPFGSYSFLAFIDYNNNQQMDFSAQGIPLEPYATSGAQNLYSPPTWEASKAELNKEMISVELNFVH